MNLKFHTNRFDSIEYLKTGTPTQQSIYKTLTESCVLSILKEYTPTLTGTFPIGINVENSDLDIICYMQDKDKFIKTLNQHFGSMKDYRLTSFVRNNKDIVLANFFFGNVEFEIFGQNTPVKEQNAYRHLVNEYRILNEQGEDFRQRIIQLKRQGIKTEPAFAQELGLDGDPYLAMLNIE